MSRTGLISAVSALAILAGCAAPTTTPTPTTTSQPAPVGEPAPQQRPAKQRTALNLSGFPAPYQDGYTAGCGSRRDGGRRREEERYKADTNYKMGWDDGYAICAARK